MRYLLVADAVLAALGGVMALSVGFVALAFTIYVDASPKVRAGLPPVLIVTACFAAIFVLAGAAALGVRRERPWHWILQALLLIALPLLSALVLAQLRTA